MQFRACFGRAFSRRNAFRLAGSFFLLRRLGAQTDQEEFPKRHLLSFPARDPRAATGSQFAAAVGNLDPDQRECAILRQLLRGNIPSFLRKLVPVKLRSKKAEGPTVSATIFVMPEYLAIGSDEDFLRIPMNLYTARAIADRFQCVLPTKKMVDAIYDQSPYRFIPQPMPAGPQMRSTGYYRAHNALITQQSGDRGIPVGPLVAGHKKDVVLTNRLAGRPGQIAIYGWHRGEGDPIQPLSTVHGARYADYSHGIRLVSRTAIVNGKTTHIDDVLRDSSLADVLSHEGPLGQVLDLWARQPATEL